LFSDLYVTCASGAAVHSSPNTGMGLPVGTIALGFQD